MDDLSTVYFGLAAPSYENYVDQVNIIVRGTYKIQQHDVTVYIIGSSHYIVSESLDYSEIITSKKFSEDNRNINITEFRGELKESFLNATMNAEQHIEIVDYNKEHDALNHTVKHTFDNGGVTSVHIEGEKITTVHTYPELNTTILTTTTFTFK